MAQKRIGCEVNIASFFAWPIGVGVGDVLEGDPTPPEFPSAG
jgi:hypothetical protein